MNLESQVSNKELSLRLRDLGVKQESNFYWKISTNELCFEIRTQSMDDWVSAFTVAELGEMLPAGIEKDYSTMKIMREIGHSGWIVVYSNRLGILKKERADTEADARAKCLIYLLENGLIKG